MHFFFLTLSFLLTRYCKVFKQQCLSSDFSPSDFSPIDSSLFPILLPIPYRLIFSLSPDLLPLVTNRPSSNVEEFLTRVYAHAPSNRIFDFLLSQVSHQVYFHHHFSSFSLPLWPTYPSFSFLQNHSPKRHFEQFFLLEC